MFKTRAQILLFTGLVAGLTLITMNPPFAQDFDGGAPDSVTVEWSAVNAAEGKWRAEVSMKSDDDIAAMTLPFRWGMGDSPFVFDSATYRGLRTEYFAVKTQFADTTKQTLLLGLISDMGAGLPPLPPGDGPVVHIFFSRTSKAKGTKIMQPTLETTTLPPANRLQLVTPDIRSIYPKFGTRQSIKQDSASMKSSPK